MVVNLACGFKSNLTLGTVNASDGAVGKSYKKLTKIVHPLSKYIFTKTDAS